MKQKVKPEIPQADRDDYWSMARQPLHCLLFLLPLLVVYEIGVDFVAAVAHDDVRVFLGHNQNAVRIVPQGGRFAFFVATVAIKIR